MIEGGRNFRREIVSVIGGSGFIGRHVVGALAEAGWRVRVICRHPELAQFLQPLGAPGQIAFVRADVKDADSIHKAAAGSTAVLNLVGILAERRRQTFEAVHVKGAAAAASAAKETGAQAFIHISAIGADEGSSSAYGRTKARGEAEVRRIFPEAVILRPSIVVGPEDQFFNRFAAMARLSPFIPLIGGGHTRFQPVYVADIAHAVVKLLDTGAFRGQVLELGGPEVLSFRELMQYMLRVIHRWRILLPIPFGLAKVMAWPAQFLPGAPLTPDQVEMLKRDNVVSDAAVAEKRTFEGLGMEPEGIEAVVPPYLVRYSPAGQFEVVREAIGEMLRAR